MQLQKGEKRSLADLHIASSQCRVDVAFGLIGVDIAAFGLSKAQKIEDDRYVVLFSNKASPERAITLEGDNSSVRFSLRLDDLPVAVDRVVFTATHDTQPIATSKPLLVTIDGKVTFNVAEHLTTEKAVMMVEFYRHSSGWKFGTIAAGFAGGLASLIQHFGGEVADSPAPASPLGPTLDHLAPTPVPAPAKPISLKKVTLEKSNSRVSLTKTGSSFGEIILNLNWNQQQGKRGFFGGGLKNLDLDLGCIFELKNGFKGVVQALGRTFGNYHDEPYIELSGDDRTGAVAAGETIRINGRHFDEIKRIGVFALIYDGAVNWQQTDGIVRMSMPDQPEIEVQMNEGRNDKRLCGIAIIENHGGQLEMERHMQYYESQQPFADAIGIHLRWRAASKD